MASVDRDPLVRNIRHRHVRCEQCRPHRVEHLAGCVVVASELLGDLSMGGGFEPAATERLVVGGDDPPLCIAEIEFVGVSRVLSGDSCRCSAIGAGGDLDRPGSGLAVHHDADDASAGQKPSPAPTITGGRPGVTIANADRPAASLASTKTRPAATTTPSDTRDPQISGGHVSESDSTCASPAELGDVAIAQHHGVGPMGSDA